VGVVGHFWNGTLILQAPRDPVGLAAMALETSGRPLGRILGPFDQAEAVRMALVPNRVALGPGREPLYRVDLEALIVPEALRSGALICRPARTEDQPRLLDWRLDFLAEAMDQRPTPDLRSAEAVLVDRLIADSWQFVLEDRGRPVAMAAYNAALPDTVQIGGVWTPPEIRGRTYGRAVVAGALLAAKARGVAEAILFTNETNLAAQRAYAALGFERIGAYALILFAD